MGRPRNAPLPAGTDHVNHQAPLCGKPLTPEDRKVWQQAVALLMGLVIRNGFGKADLCTAMQTALEQRRAASTRNCQDCGVKVPHGGLHTCPAAINLSLDKLLSQI
jgi:hypothetical protein